MKDWHEPESGGGWLYAEACLTGLVMLGGLIHLFISALIDRI